MVDAQHGGILRPLCNWKKNRQFLELLFPWPIRWRRCFDGQSVLSAHSSGLLPAFCSSFSRILNFLEVCVDPFHYGIHLFVEVIDCDVPSRFIRYWRYAVTRTLHYVLFRVLSACGTGTLTMTFFFAADVLSYPWSLPYMSMSRVAATTWIQKPSCRIPSLCLSFGFSTVMRTTLNYLNLQQNPSCVFDNESLPVIRQGHLDLKWRILIPH